MNTVYKPIALIGEASV